jgi:hypothetical protein
MAYVPFTNDYSSQRTPAYVAAELAKRTAVQSRVNDIITGGNAAMGGLIADCCSDPAFAGQGFYDDSLGVFATPGSTATDPMAVLPAPGSYPLTPVDILTGTYGFPTRIDGKPWPRPLIPRRFRSEVVNSFPNIGPARQASRLVPPCPCFSTAAPVMLPVPVVATPPPIAVPVPAAPAKKCFYPDCSTGNVCLDLDTGCVLNSQVTQDQVLACTLAGYGSFGNMAYFVADVMQGCQPPKYLGTPLPNPPQATGSMIFDIQKVTAKKGVSGFGQVEEGSNVGGFFAIVALAGIVVWGMRKR